jgi:hypothetical protein
MNFTDLAASKMNRSDMYCIGIQKRSEMNYLAQLGTIDRI